MSYTPILSVVVPTSGGCKRLWSPQLFNAYTGVYSLPTSGSVCGYPLDNSGRAQFYEGSIPETEEQGYIQCTLSNPGTPTYWNGSFEVLNASTREVLGSGDFKLSSDYTYRPGYVSPYMELSQIHYTDAAMNSDLSAYSGGGDQKVAYDAGTYIIKFKEVNSYTLLSSGPPATFSVVTATSASTMEYEIIVVPGETTVQSFAKI